MRFKDYEVLEGESGPIVLGRGGVGVTYKGQDIKLGSFVAIKVIQPQWVKHEEVRMRFLRESQTAARVSDHPNIARVLASGEEDGTCYYVMEYVNGETLRNLVSRGRLSVEDTLNIASQITKALQALARRGILHRDLKPENIMLATHPGYDRLVKLLDFGVAKVREDAVKEEAADSPNRITGPREAWFTSEYASPEQILQGTLDASSDFYSLGIILWELVTGNRPFAGEGRVVENRHLNERPNFKDLEDTPPLFRNLLELLLEKDAKARPQSADALAGKIETCLAEIHGERYIILGPGNHPAVRKACLKGDPRPLALRTISDDLAVPTRQQLFATARAVRENSRPTLLKLIDISDRFVATEWNESPTVAGLLTECSGELPWDLVMSWLHPVAATVDWFVDRGLHGLSLDIRNWRISFEENSTLIEAADAIAGGRIPRSVIRLDPLAAFDAQLISAGIDPHQKSNGITKPPILDGLDSSQKVSLLAVSIYELLGGKRLASNHHVPPLASLSESENAVLVSSIRSRVPQDSARKLIEKLEIARRESNPALLVEASPAPIPVEKVTKPRPHWVPVEKRWPGKKVAMLLAGGIGVVAAAITFEGHFGNSSPSSSPPLPVPPQPTPSTPFPTPATPVPTPTPKPTPSTPFPTPATPVPTPTPKPTPSTPIPTPATPVPTPTPKPTPSTPIPTPATPAPTPKPLLNTPPPTPFAVITPTPLTGQDLLKLLDESSRGTPVPIFTPSNWQVHTLFGATPAPTPPIPTPQEPDAVQLFANASAAYRGGSFSEALDLYTRAVAAGSTSALYPLGEMYFRGKGTKRDIAQAQDYLQRAVAAGDAEAQCFLGNLYSDGYGGVKRDDAKAFELLTKSAAQGNATAKAYLANMYINGQGTPRDVQKALDLLQKSAQSGNGWAQATLSGLYRDGKFGALKKDLPKADAFEHSAIPALQKSASDGDADSLIQLGVIYQKGRGSLKKSEVKARELFEQAIQQGSPAAEYVMSDSYLNGPKTLRDRTKGIQLLKQAADHGLSDAQVALADLYYHGKEGLPKNEKLAFELCSNAAADNNAGGLEGLAEFYNTGNSVVKKDVSHAIELLFKASEYGSVNAQAELGLCYLFGTTSTPVDEAKAKQLLTLAANQDDPQAQVGVGYLYENGKGGVGKNEVTAVAYYQKSADQGNGDGQARLGMMYENGKGGLKKNGNKALDLYLKSARQENSLGEYCLASAYNNELGGSTRDPQKIVALLQKVADQDVVQAIVDLADCYENGFGVPKNPTKARLLRERARKLDPGFTRN